MEGMQGLLKLRNTERSLDFILNITPKKQILVYAQ